MRRRLSEPRLPTRRTTRVVHGGYDVGPESGRHRKPHKREKTAPEETGDRSIIDHPTAREPGVPSVRHVWFDARSGLADLEQRGAFVRG